MSTRHAFLALLAQGPRHGYRLRVDFEASTGATRPLNIGQVYTTLNRLERDGLVTAGEEDEQGRVVYAITEAGRKELERWFDTPVVPADRPRDELVVKLAMAVTTPGVDVRAVIRRQRAATMRRLQELTMAKREGERTGRHGTAYRLVLDSLIFQTEAEQRWLDHCEALLLAPRPPIPPQTNEEER